MESFYWTVLVIAIIALIGALTYVGILMTYYTNQDTTYPPVASSCPDFWSVSPTNANECVIPPGDAEGIKNVGTIYNETEDATSGDTTYNLQLTTDNTPGLNASSGIDFSHAGWGVGSGAICKKRTWANQYGLTWDGISNYNSC